MLPGAMRRARVIEDEVFQAVREQGLASVDDVRALVLETDGSFSVVTRAPEGERTALSNVKREAVGSR